MIRKDFLDAIVARLGEPRRFLQVVAGPRQVGKTTLVRQALEALEARSVYASADDPALRGPTWLDGEWERARRLARQPGAPVVLALDEVQKVTG